MPPLRRCAACGLGHGISGRSVLLDRPCRRRHRRLARAGRGDRRRSAAAGATVYAVGRSAATAVRAPPGATYRSCDVTDSGAFEALLAEIAAALGRLDILVNAAAIRRLPSRGCRAWRCSMRPRGRPACGLCRVPGGGTADRPVRRRLDHQRHQHRQRAGNPRQSRLCRGQGRAADAEPGRRSTSPR